MGKIKSDVRGISPVVATILLIAATGIAAGVIIAYVGGLFVTSPTIRDVTVEGLVYDWDTGATENYLNGDVFITIKVISGGLRDVGDPTYGFNVALSNPRTGWSMSFAQPTGGFITSYGSPTTWTQQDNIYPAATDGENMVGTITVPTTSAGTVAVGSAITISLNMPAVYQSAGVGIDNAKWKDKDTINVIISARDSVTKTGYDGAYISGVAYAV